MQNRLPSFLKVFFWSFDFTKLHKEADKKRIITQILNFGTKRATDWLFSEYTISEIKDSIQQPLVGEWDKKSINYWSLYFNVKAGNLIRKVS